MHVEIALRVHWSTTEKLRPVYKLCVIQRGKEPSTEKKWKKYSITLITYNSR